MKETGKPVHVFSTFLLTPGFPARQVPGMNAGNTKHGGNLAVLGVLLQIGAAFSLRTVFSGIANFFYQIFSNGLGDPATLLPGFSEIFEAGAVGFAVAGAGLVAFCAALVGCRYRAPWFFWFLIVDGTLLLVALPIGTIFGGFFLVYCLRHRAEF